jgi:hypothetical protein
MPFRKEGTTQKKCMKEGLTFNIFAFTAVLLNLF